MGTPGATIAGIVGSLGLVAAIWAAEEIRIGAGVDVAAVTLATCYATYAGVALTRGDSREIGVENAFLGLGLVFVGLGLWHHPHGSLLDGRYTVVGTSCIAATDTCSASRVSLRGTS
jgi:hypothetical protein